MPVAQAPPRGSEAPPDGTEAPAEERPFVLRYFEGLVARPGRLLTALLATTLAAVVVSEAAGRTSDPRRATPSPAA